MKEGIFQFDNNCLPHPYDHETLDRCKEFKPNQLVKIKMYGIEKPRSYKQLKTYKGCCEMVADNLDQFTDKEDVDWEVRVKLKHIGRMTVIGKQVICECKSISYAELKHLMACRFFDRAFDLMAYWMGITKDELIEQLKDRLEKKHGRQPEPN